MRHSTSGYLLIAALARNHFNPFKLRQQRQPFSLAAPACLPYSKNRYFILFLKLSVPNSAEHL
jgi:hypothetical protein